MRSEHEKHTPTTGPCLSSPGQGQGRTSCNAIRTGTHRAALVAAPRAEGGTQMLTALVFGASARGSKCSTMQSIISKDPRNRGRLY